SYRVELPPDLKRRGIHPVFHASRLRVHVPNDDRLFPGRKHDQLGFSTEKEPEWQVKSILDHRGRGTSAKFEVEWAAGDRTWLPYRDVEKFVAFQDYLEVQGVKHAKDL
ncbi:hypothetical protein BDZ89DRAFT_901664, partial [Hymenopellis radicata]